jgi:hypothetical protein
MLVLIAAALAVGVAIPCGCAEIARRSWDTCIES